MSEKNTLHKGSCKIQIFVQEKRKRQDERKKVAEALGDAAPPKLVPKTLDNQREHDETTVVNKIKDAAGKEIGQEEIDEEVSWDIDNDELKEYFRFCDPTEIFLILTQVFD